MTLRDAMAVVFEEAKKRKASYGAFYSRHVWLKQQYVEVFFDFRKGWRLRVRREVDSNGQWQAIEFTPEEWIWNACADDWTDRFAEIKKSNK